MRAASRAWTAFSPEIPRFWASASSSYILFSFSIYRVSQKNALSECCWSHSSLAQSSFAGTPCVWRLIFWSFLTKTKEDQAPPSHVNGPLTMVKFSPIAFNICYDFVLLVQFFRDTLYIPPFLASSCSGLPPVNPSQDQRICLQWIKGQESKDFNLLYISFWKNTFFTLE